MDATKLSSVMWFLVVMILLTPVALGQSTRASLRGIVTDEKGGLLPGAVVTARNTETNQKSSVTADDSGYYLIPNLTPGTYELTVDHPGFTTFTQPGIALQVGQSATFDTKLQTGAVQANVTVSNEAPLIENTNTSMSQVVEGRKILDLPINGREFIDFALLTPAVAPGQALSAGSQTPFFEQVTKISFSGLGDQSTNFFALDGADYNVIITGYQHSGPSQDAVREFRVVQNTYKTEFGRNLGGYVNVVTKSGTNNLHGSGFFYMRNDALDATNILSSPNFDKLDRYQYGATIGGPIKRDRSFFFGSFEGRRQSESPIYPTVLLQNLTAINQVKSFYRLSAENPNILRRNDSDEFLFRFDHQLTKKHQLTARYIFTNQTGKNVPGSGAGVGAPSSFRDNHIKDQSVVGQVVSLFSATTYNEVLFQYSRRSNEYVSPNGEPNLDIPNFLTMGKTIGGADFYREGHWQVADNLSITKGKHSLKFGGDFNKINDFLVGNYAVNGYFIFIPPSFFGTFPFDGTIPGTVAGQPTPVFAILGLPSDLIGVPFKRTTDWRQLYPSPLSEDPFLVRYGLHTIDFFAQDEWRVKNNLTIDYGVRYFYEATPPALDMNKDQNNFGPRLGVAYSFWNNRAVLRGGAGMYISNRNWGAIGGNLALTAGEPGNDVIPSAIADQFRRVRNSSAFWVGPIPVPAILGPVAFDFIANGQYPSGPLPKILVNHNQRDFPNPYAIRGSLDLQLQLRPDLSLTFGYLGVHSLKNSLEYEANVIPIGLNAQGKTLYTNKSFNYFFYDLNVPVNNAIYHGGTLTVEKRFSNNFAFTGNYTYSKAIDSVFAGTVSFADFPEDPTNFHLSRAVSNQHIGHRFVFSGLAEGPRDSFLRKIKLGTIVTLQSPRYFSLYVGQDVNGDGNTSTDRVDALGRNSYKGDRYAAVDLRLSREFSFTEAVKGEFLAEAFNLFNRANVTLVNTVYGAPTFIGQVPTHYKDGAPGALPSFGSPSATAAARQIQLGFRMIW